MSRYFREGGTLSNRVSKIGLMAVLSLLAANAALAQPRVQFPSSTVPTQSTPPNYWPQSPPSYGAPNAPPSLPPGTNVPLPPQPAAPPGWDPYAQPSMPMSQPYSPYAPSPYAP